MQSFDELKEVVRQLRAEDGCPWDRAQTHTSLKAACIEEAAEVICGINVYEETGNAENLKEELGDLPPRLTGSSLVKFREYIP